MSLINRTTVFSILSFLCFLVESLPQTPPSPGGGKTGAGGSAQKGLAFNNTSPSLDVFDPYSSITWCHNWNSAPNNGADSKFPFVPTLWSDQSPHSENWASLAQGHSELLSFNEPDNAWQANMRVDDAVSAYRRLMMPLRINGVRLGAPSVSNGVGINDKGIEMGMGWLNDFLDKCNKEATNGACIADFVSVHWYGCTDGCSVETDVAAFQDFISKAKEPGLPVWITEFQRFGDVGTQQQFLDGVLGWLEGQVERYAYFMVQDGILTNGGQVSELGNKYATG